MPPPVILLSPPKIPFADLPRHVGGRTIAVIEVDDLRPVALGRAALALLTVDERARMSLFHHDTHAMRYARRRLMLRTLLAHCAGRSPLRVSYRYGCYGKPYLVSVAGGATGAGAFQASGAGGAATAAFGINAGATGITGGAAGITGGALAAAAGAARYYFSLTHMTTKMIVAVSGASDIGIDCESYRRWPVTAAIAQLLGISTALTQQQFICYWTAREALAKCLGLSVYNVPARGLLPWASRPLPPPRLLLIRGRGYRLQPLALSPRYATTCVTATWRRLRMIHCRLTAERLLADASRQARSTDDRR